LTSFLLFFKSFFNTEEILVEELVEHHTVGIVVAVADTAVVVAAVVEVAQR
jgi:hypothetical protein